MSDRAARAAPKSGRSLDTKGWRRLVRKLRWNVLDPLHDDPRVGWARALNDAQSRVAPLQARRLRVAAPRLDAPLRLAWASDLHAGPTTGELVLEQAARAIADFAPHVLVLGGDYIYRDTRYVERLRPFVRRCRGKLATLAICGNHDVVEGRDAVMSVLADEGADVLVNEARRLAPPHDALFIAALDDYVHGDANGDAALAGIPPDAPLIYLTHNPDGVLELGQRRALLSLAGHTHGGHICLPGGRPLLVPTNLGFIAGGYDTRWGRLFVSRGVGSIDVPFRMFAPPDVVLVELVRHVDATVIQ